MQLALPSTKTITCSYKTWGIQWENDPVAAVQQLEDDKRLRITYSILYGYARSTCRNYLNSLLALCRQLGILTYHLGSAVAILSYYLRLV